MLKSQQRLIWRRARRATNVTPLSSLSSLTNLNNASSARLSSAFSTSANFRYPRNGDNRAEVFTTDSQTIDLAVEAESGKKSEQSNKAASTGKAREPIINGNPRGKSASFTRKPLIPPSSGFPPGFPGIPFDALPPHLRRNDPSANSSPPPNVPTPPLPQSFSKDYLTKPTRPYSASRDTSNLCGQILTSFLPANQGGLASTSSLSSKPSSPSSRTIQLDASARSTQDPTIHLICPLEGSEHVVRKTIEDAAGMIGAEVVRVEGVLGVACGQWGVFGKGEYDVSSDALWRHTIYRLS